MRLQKTKQTPEEIEKMVREAEKSAEDKKEKGMLDLFYL
jgi:hypothetical protein